MANRQALARWCLSRAGASLVVAGCISLVLLTAWPDDPSALWRDVYHDRNTHLARGFDVALALRAGDGAGVLEALTRITVWPPLHPLLLGLLLVPVPLGPAWGVVPGMLGWGLAMAFSWAIAMRVTPDARQGIVAGVVVVGLLAVSPALRLLSTDVMHEGLGAGLSAMALHAFLRCAEAPARGARAAWFGACLSLLFFTKYNYWLILMAALGVGLLPEVWRAAWALPRGAVIGCIRTLRWPLLALLLLTAGVGWVAMRAPLDVTLAGRALRVYPGHVFALGHGLLLVGLCLLWRRVPPGLLPPSVPTVLAWHGMPVLLWFLVPDALLSFLWFIGPTHSGATLAYQPLQALLFQWAGFSQGFHVAPWSAASVLGAAILGGALLWRRGPGPRAVALLALVSAAIVVLHPQQQWRFQATSLFAVWLCAGAGVAAVVARFGRGGLAVALVWLGLHIFAEPDRAMADAVAIRRPAAPSDLALAAAYLPLAGDDVRVGFVASFGVSDLFAWTLQAACDCRRTVEQPWLQASASRADVRRLADNWLASAPVARLVAIEMQAPYSLPNMGPGMAGLADALAGQSRFVATPAAVVGAARVTLWMDRAGDPPQKPMRHRLAGLLSLAFAVVSLGAVLWPSGRGMVGADRHKA